MTEWLSIEAVRKSGESRTIGQRLQQGEVVALGHKLYVLCRDCGSVVRINKPFVGSMHFCETPEVIAGRRGQGPNP
jgi:hypothetical protein